MPARVLLADIFRIRLHFKECEFKVYVSKDTHVLIIREYPLMIFSPSLKWDMSLWSELRIVSAHEKRVM